jgi:hypothetical protein
MSPNWEGDCGVVLVCSKVEKRIKKIYKRRNTPLYNIDETKSLTINDLSLTLDLCSTCVSEFKNILHDFSHKRPTDSVDRVTWLKEESLS